MNYESMTTAELEAELAAINDQRAALKEKALLVHRVLDSKNARDAAQRTYDRMTDAERAALHQMLAADGLSSGGAVGGF